MEKIPEDAVSLFGRQSFAIVSTIDEGGWPHNSCKGVLKVEKGRVYLVDLYVSETYRNLGRDPRMSVTVVDEAWFKGYCLKGKGRIVKREDLSPEIREACAKKRIGRIADRMIKNLHQEPGHPARPEVSFPEPKYLIVLEVEKVVDLALFSHPPASPPAEV